MTNEKMPPNWRYALVLTIIGAITTALLAVTYRLAAPQIHAGEQAVAAAAIRELFFNSEVKIVPHGDIYEIYSIADSAVPDFFAAVGQGIGYNKTAPLILVAGFVNPQKESAVLPDGEKIDGLKNNELICVGWKIIQSQETPGLGENARAAAPAMIWSDWLRGKNTPAVDRRSHFQRQFSGRNVFTLRAKKNVDVLTGATLTTNGIIEALNAAAQKIVEHPVSGNHE